MTNIKVLGIGGAGCNILDKVLDLKLPGIDGIALEFDWCHLELSRSPVGIRLNPKWSDLKIPNREHRREDVMLQQPEIQQAIGAADAVIVTAGLGGSAGSGGAPALLEIAREMGIMAIAVVNTPFAFEWSIRKEMAAEGLKDIGNLAEFLCVLSGDVVSRLPNYNTDINRMFRELDVLMVQLIQNTIGLITNGNPSLLLKPERKYD